MIPGGKERRPVYNANMPLDGFTSDELKEIKVNVDAISAECRAKLDSAKAERAATGNYADRDWYRKTSDALRLSKMLSQRIQHEQSRRKGIGLKPVQVYFIEYAEEMLSPELFNKIMARAQQAAINDKIHQSGLLHEQSVTDAHTPYLDPLLDGAGQS